MGIMNEGEITFSIVSSENQSNTRGDLAKVTANILRHGNQFNIIKKGRFSCQYFEKK